MKPCASFRHGTFKPLEHQVGSFLLSRSPWRAFTLLEMCLVLFIIALMVGAALPAIESVFVEQGLRNDSHQLVLMVKTAMIQSSEQHRPYLIELTSTNMIM